MANSMTPNDVYLIMNEIASQATGRTDLKVTDTTTFQTVGELLLRTGTESLLNSISNVVGKTIFSIRPYKQKFESLLVSKERWGAHTRKIVTLYSEAEESTDYNTVEKKPLTDGESVDMYKIAKPKVIQLNFYGTKVLQKHITRFRDQLSTAFHNESEFIQFIDAIMTEFYNEIELLNEEKSRLTVLSHIAGIVNMKNNGDDMGNVIDLVAEYNARYNVTHTREELLSTYIESFMKFVASQVKIYANRLTDMTTLYHKNFTAYAPIMRHSPKERQKMIMYNPIFIEAESTVYSSLFNPNYLDIGMFEGVNFWQNPKEPTRIQIKPNILNSDGTSTDGTNTDIPFVLGILFDEEALGIMPQFDYSSTTPFNSAGGYYNMYMHWRFNSYSDYTENAIVFVLGSGGE